MATNQPDASEIRRRGRQRLIGAVAIAVVLIVFVPMVLDSDPRPARQEPDLKIPSRENPPPLPAPKAAPAEARIAPVETKPPVEAKSAEPAAKSPPPKVAVVQPKVTPAATAKEGFVIQVGAFADESKAQQLKEKLAASNIAAYTEPAGSLTRIRVGPFTTRDAADKTIPAVRLIVPDAKVVSLP